MTQTLNVADISIITIIFIRSQSERYDNNKLPRRIAVRNIQATSASSQAKYIRPSNLCVTVFDWKNLPTCVK